ncbi:uncharacterized protein TNIN_36261 [Trichonephila inaurata madagascariensis]|uniref:Uncharacterized protein n=2 Tax=Trichonephila inaurata madagascariensis TaxID=2747483 RepID=A0A8X6Y3Q9_9ARAC|nr:uncharacterized protein TNIN_36261 [Trichonephila inaurata madagascariensis]
MNSSTPKEKENPIVTLRTCLKSRRDEHKQHNKMKSTNLQQGLDTKGKGPEDLHPKAKLEVKEAAKGLKEELQKSDAGSNQSIETKAPNQTTTQDIDNSKTMKR